MPVYTMLRTYTHMYMYIHIWVYTCIHTHVYVQVYIHTYIYTHISIYTYVCICIRMHMHVYVHMYVYTSQNQMLECKCWPRSHVAFFRNIGLGLGADLKQQGCRFSGGSCQGKVPACRSASEHWQALGSFYALHTLTYAVIYI